MGAARPAPVYLLTEPPIERFVHLEVWVDVAQGVGQGWVDAHDSDGTDISGAQEEWRHKDEDWPDEAVVRLLWELHKLTDRQPGMAS